MIKIGDLFPVKGIKPGHRDAQGSIEKPVPGLSKMHLEVGQLLKGRVLSFGADGKVVLEIGGKTITALSQAALKAGSDVWLEVKQTGTTPWLALAGKKGIVMEFLRTALSDNSAIGQTVKNLLGMIPTGQEQSALKTSPELEQMLMSLSENTISEKPDMGKLLKMVSWISAAGSDGKSSGPFFARLGGLLAEMVTAAGKQGGRPGEAAKTGQGLEKLSRMVEMHCRLNSQPISMDQTPFFIFPCFFSGEAGWGEWIFSMDQEDDSGGSRQQEHYTLSFFLDMSRIGEVRLKVRLADKALQGEFSMAGETAVSHMEKYLPDLTRILEKMGFGPVTFSCCVAKTGMFQEFRAALQESAGIESFSILDVTA
ncbi:MAG: hypothetical protein U9O82_00440 [Thermodesulfobacteriota bacterium]|nr:hypothetical protein [Thermodesulfobacteriota bacterium]